MSDKDDQEYDPKRIGRIETAVAEQGVEIKNITDALGRVVKKMDFIATELGKTGRTDWQTLAAWTTAILVLISMAGWPILDRLAEVREDQKQIERDRRTEALEFVEKIAKLQENQRIYHEELPELKKLAAH